MPAGGPLDIISVRNDSLRQLLDDLLVPKELLQHPGPPDPDVQLLLFEVMQPLADILVF